MSSNFVDTVRQAIHERYHLKRKNRDWLLEESGKTIKLRVPDQCSIGFSLDSRDPNPLSFFSDSPPQHLAKMCDAIIVLLYKREFYVFVLEAKTGNQDDADKQLVNGKYFCDWLITLCKKYGYLEADPVCIGLLIWQPRPSPVYKGTTAHQADNGIEKRDSTTFDAKFELQNRTDIHLGELIKRLG